MKTKIGGDRLGSGSKQEIQMKTYSRSTHDLSYLWRSSMSAGTLVPFMSEVGLPGDSFDIDMNCEVMTLPTVGPLFGSYKVQLDIFECPIRLYNGKLHMNMLNIGMDMSKIMLPQLVLEADAINGIEDDNAQINSSCIFSYLNIRGLGKKSNDQAGQVKREFNAVPYLGYWDIYKNYYANKQEEEGVVIHSLNEENDFEVESCEITVDGVSTIETYSILGATETVNTSAQGTGAENPLVELNMELIWIHTAERYGEPDKESIEIEIDGTIKKVTTLWQVVAVYQNPNDTSWYVKGTGYRGAYNVSDWEMSEFKVPNTETQQESPPRLSRFPLENIDEMRMDILADVKATTPFKVRWDSMAPYNLPIKRENGKWAKLTSQEGLGIKTYQSDLFNNWISTEWIDGTNGINEVTAVSTADGEFTIDALNLANKVYNMLNRIAISGGSYDDWLDAVYTHERARSTENPIYHGSLIKELGFEEVISTADTTIDGNQQPLGTLAGRGRLSEKNKGGKVTIKVNEPSYIIGIVSLTPRIDYSQGNKWDVNLKTMNDFHKPALDEIGYQDLIVDQMAWFSTKIVESTGEVQFKSAGKQPAWINYMTNVNQVRGNFAMKEKEMFMTLNRRYEGTRTGVKDITTYIDPTKYNNIFAQTNLDSQNFWVQISNKITARRKMSAKVIPNL
jgi:hypothetical protein